MQPQVKPKSYTYDVQVRWSEERRGILTARGKPPLEVASPPEFKGHPDIWTPEDLLVSAVASCTMTTFLALAARKEVELISYECEATGTLEMVEWKFRFSRVVLRPRIVVARAEDRDKVMDIFRQAEASCLVANSLLTKVEGEPEVLVRT